jgi:hypothetical protein
MQYILRIGPWHVGPFPTHIGAQHWAERHGCDDYTMIPLDDPAEAPIRIHRPAAELRARTLRMAELQHPMKARE